MEDIDLKILELSERTTDLIEEQAIAMNRTANALERIAEMIEAELNEDYEDEKSDLPEHTATVDEFTFDPTDPDSVANFITKDSAPWEISVKPQERK